ncbi:MAG: C4-type zinc ribbon domain-containing protein [Treponemataceae bacterium]|nr:C4-type zinc ribbon domain-containing protein [Treponemataceae bacterium]
MEMEVVFDKLKTLQDILSEKYTLELQIDEAPKKLSSQEESLSKMKKEFIEKNEGYEVLRQKVLALKTQLAEAEAARERGEKGMDSITSHREYEALEKEIKDATEKELATRRELQKEEKNFNELDEELKNRQQLIEFTEKDLNERKENISKETEELKGRLSELESEEKEIAPDIDPEIIFKFQRIIKSKHSRGIVAVRGNVCDGCHMILPAQFANEVHAGEKIVFCPYCSRILYYEEDESGESEFFHLDDTGSLADLDDELDEENEDAEYDEMDEEGRSGRDDVRELGYDD